MSASRIQAYQYFQTDDIPTESQFQFVFNNLWFKDEKFPIVQIEGLTEMFQGTMSSQAFTNHLNDTSAHAGYLALLNASNLTASNINEWKSKLGISYVATVDGSDQVGNVNTKVQIQAIVDQLNMQDDEALELIEAIREKLVSDDGNLDNIQEIVDFIKENRQNIDDILAKLLTDDTNLDNVQEIVDFIKENRQNIDILKNRSGLEDLISDDESLLIEPANNNIESNVSIFSEEFENHPTSLVSISFEPIQILGVFDGGLKLNSNEYDQPAPTRINLTGVRKYTLFEPLPNVIEVQYTHLKTDL
jgi:hypothetical protein